MVNLDAKKGLINTSPAENFFHTVILIFSIIVIILKVGEYNHRSS
jgi:hypothetical protein